ncbi:MAG: rhodanese-like domain-containing protein [candidate division Zixibacteria bacterium]|nr:rhodanese-like domain-containing protein [candidate division Zixibacteria bacterium]
MRNKMRSDWPRKLLFCLVIIITPALLSCSAKTENDSADKSSQNERPSDEFTKTTGIEGSMTTETSYVRREGSTISVAELKAAMDSGEKFALLDVRTQSEYDEAHLEGVFALIPFDQIIERASELPQDKKMPIFSFCRSGRRSGVATLTLRELGYEQAFNIEGGIIAWNRAGLPLAK